MIATIGCAAGAAAATLVLLAPRAGAGANGAAPTRGDAFEPVIGLPARDVVVLGAAPASGETWAYGVLGAAPADTQAGPRREQLVLLDHTEGSGWQDVALPDNAHGEPLANVPFPLPSELNGLGGRVTRAGGVVLLTDGGIVARDPGQAPQLVPAPPVALLGKGESLPPAAPPSGASTPYAAIEDASHTGILIAPYDDGRGQAPAVLYYDGDDGAEHWTREPIETPIAGGPGYNPALTPMAIACGGAQPFASAPDDCWMLVAYKHAEAANAPDRLALFRRVETGAGDGWSWREQPVEDPTDPLLGEIPAGAGEPSAVQTLGPTAQTLTPTSQGVWVDLEARLPSGGTTFTKLVVPSAEGRAQAVGTWCETGATYCLPGSRPLESPLPSSYRSFAWPGSGSEPGTRIVTGLEHRAMLELAPGANGFALVVGAGGVNGSADGAAAFSDPQHGWIADGTEGSQAVDGGGEPQAIELTPAPEGDQLQEESVPFRRPLYAVAQAPGTTPGDPGAPAIAVGEDGEVAHFLPGQGWQQEALLNGSGFAVPATLRGVAWPEPGRAYAVGDNGQMWLWQAATGLWEPDPAKPVGFVGNLDAIAFSASDPTIGYAVGRQGLLLSYGKTWEQEPLPPELQDVNFTSIAFTGAEEAIASYRYLGDEGRQAGEEGREVETGGVAIRRSSSEPWHVDPQASALLATLPVRDRVLSRVAGLPDGGAVAAGPGLVIERDAAGGPWRFSTQPLTEAQNISALGAYREPGGAVRAVVSEELDQQLNPLHSDVALEGSPFGIDVPAPTGPGQPPPILAPDMVPNSGYVLKETAAGWSDMEHETLPIGGYREDAPARPDPVLALLISPSGANGLAVGGQTGNIEGYEPNVPASEQNPGVLGSQTAAVMRFPAASASANGALARPVVPSAGNATFVVAGQAACETACAQDANLRLAPDVDLTHAIQAVDAIDANSGALRALLYTGGRLEQQPSRGEKKLELAEFERELDRYAELFGAASTQNGPRIAVAASPDDIAPEDRSVGPERQGLNPFLSRFGSYLPGAAPGGAYYEFESTGAQGGKVDVIVLDFSSGTIEGAQAEWLEHSLLEAHEQRTPAIVVGNSSLSPTLPDGPSALDAKDLSQVAQILVEGHTSPEPERWPASAYFFDYPAANVKTSVRYGNAGIPAYGTGTLGYVPSPDERLRHDALGSSGFLLAEVETAKGDPAPVNVRVVLNIAHLALDATGGTLLRRSEATLFDALARRPAAGVRLESAGGGQGIVPSAPDPYDPIPFDCLGSNCENEVPTEYAFTSSDPEVGAFVEHDPASSEPDQVKLGANQLPIPDEPRNRRGVLTTSNRFAVNTHGEAINERGEVVAADQSGLFCAYNAGTTTVSVTAGGLTYSEPITVQPGTAEYPCGTVPLKNPPPTESPQQANFNTPNVVPSTQPPASLLTQTLTPPLAPPVPLKPPPRPRPTRAQVLPFLPPVPGLALLRPVLLPPPAPAARPTPPSGTSTVQAYQNAVAPQQKREEEEATDLVHNMAAYRPDPGRLILPYLPAVILLLSFAAAGLYAAGRRHRPQLARRTCPPSGERQYSA